MAENVFTDLLIKGVRSGHVPARTANARDWYREKARKTSTTAADIIGIKEGERMRNDQVIGAMSMFSYDPKHKATLPYYDKFPLIFVVDEAPNGFYGINFHYLPYPLRAKLMDALYSISSDKRYDEETKVKISYSILKNASKFSLFKPTFKHYLSKHVRSRFVLVYPSEWDIALFLPVAQFEKKTQREVWAESVKKIKNSATNNGRKRR